MRKLTILAIGTAFGLAAFGKSPLDCLDQDVVRGLLQRGLGDLALEIGTRSPPELARFKVPRQLTWVGTGERTQQMPLSGTGARLSSISAVYRSSLEPEPARTVTAAALATSGWQLHTQDRRSIEVFAQPTPFRNSETWCREGNPLTLTASAVDGVTYVILGVTRGLTDNTFGVINTCSRPPELASESRRPMDKYLPTFQLPIDPATGKRASKLGDWREGNDQKQSFNTTVVLKESLGNVVRHFEKQMREQGWAAEATFGKTGSAGSTWTRQADAGSVMRGTLIVSDFEQGRFAVIFRATRVN